MENIGIVYGHLELIYYGRLEYITAIWYILRMTIW
jgi:hypothetical protein